MGCYARAVAKAPYMFIIVDVVLALVLGPLTAKFHGLPDFSDPLSGFEPRGTDIRQWMNAAYYINQRLFDGELQLAPGITLNTTGLERLSLKAGGVLPDEQDGISLDLAEPKLMPRVALGPVVTGKNLIDPHVLISICELTDAAFIKQCGDMCKVTSLPDVIADLRGTECASLTETDVTLTVGLLQECASHYFNGNLTRDCRGSCPGIEYKCQEQGAVFRIFNEFTDSGFMADGDTTRVKLTFTMIFVQWNDTVDTLRQFFTEKIGENAVYNDHVKVVGIDLTIPQTIFRWYIIQDLVWYGLAMAIVILLLIIYLRSFILMITVVLNVIFSLLLAYFIYFMICRFTFFPFINILAALLLIALGADDLFIFYDIWRDEKQLNPGATDEELVSLILYKGGMSVFVTSFTTATALLANFVNDVTAIRCFGAFAAICVFVNFLLFITWVPAIIVITDNAYSACMGDDFCQDKSSKVWQCLYRAHNKIWKEFMPATINKVGPLWIILVMLLSLGGLVATFYHPKLDLPSSNNFRLLVPEHPFEKYVWDVKDNMRFEADRDSQFSVQFLWGISGSDDVRSMDPAILGDSTTDNSFDIYENSSQLWLNDFCQNVLSQEFVDEDFRKKSKCYWHIYKDYIELPCDPRSNTRVCCGQAFPPPYNMSKVCMSELANIMHSSENKDSDETVVGLPLFNEDNVIATYQMYIKTRYIWTASYDTMKDIYIEFEDFMKRESQNITYNVANGWFTGAYLYEFRFYDLQMSLASGTLSGIGVSLAIGFCVLLVTTLNIFLTFYAIMTIALVLSTTAGTLALMGWELNTSEALILTLSMGLSIDFTIHNGVAYKLADVRKRSDKVKDALGSVGSAITMAALTTLGAGVAMMCASVWAYRQFGIFLVLTMVISWFYANFFFLSMCSSIGPIGNIGDISCLFSCFKKCRKKDKTKENRSIGANPSSNPDRIRSDRDRQRESSIRPLPPAPVQDDTTGWPHMYDQQTAGDHVVDDVFPSEHDLANFAYPNEAYNAAPDVLPRQPVAHVANTHRKYVPAGGNHGNPSPSASDSPQGFEYKHLRKHRQSRHREVNNTSSSTSSNSIPNFHSQNDGRDDKFRPPIHNSYNKNNVKDIAKIVHSSNKRY